MHPLQVEKHIKFLEAAIEEKKCKDVTVSWKKDGKPLDIWKDLYPDRTQQINSEFESAVLQSVLSTGFSLVTGGYGIEFPDVTKWDKRKSLLKGNFLGLAGSLITAYYDKEQKLKQNAVQYTVVPKKGQVTELFHLLSPQGPALIALQSTCKV